MDIFTIDKLKLCMAEIMACKEIIEHKEYVDELCAHIFGIYVCMRMDDFTKIAGKNIPKDDECRPCYDYLKSRYNDGFRQVRDKIGSHFQHTDVEPGKDMFARVEIYSSLNLDGILSLASDADTLMELICEQKGVDKKIETLSPYSLSLILEYCRKIYLDGDAQLGVDAFAVGAKNTGCMLTCSETQRRAQLIKSLELMCDTVKGFFDLGFKEEMPKRLFKRIFISMIVNFYDNLVTREISSSAEQYEVAFDQLILNLDTKFQTADELKGYFEEFHNQYQMTPLIEKLRNTRDKACAHFDLTLSVDDISRMLDDVDDEKIQEYYKNIRQFWEYLTNKVFLLKAVSIPSRSPIYDATIEKGIECKSFYERDEGTDESVKEIKTLWRDLVKHTSDYDRSRSKLKTFLMNPNSPEYIQLLTLISLRFDEEKLSCDEANEICNLLYDAKRGYPSEILQFLLDIVIHRAKNMPTHSYVTLLYLLAVYARKENSGRLDRIICILLKKGAFLEKLYACLMILHITISDVSPVVGTKDNELDKKLKEYLDSVVNKEERAAYLISLASYWHLSDDFSFRVKELPKITTYINKEVVKSVDEFLKYAHVEEGTREEWLKLIEYNRYHQLAYYLAALELDRNHKENLFACIIANKGLPWLVNDCYEQCFQALSLELLGDKDHALKYMETITSNNPLNENIRKCYEDMRKRCSC